MIELLGMFIGGISFGFLLGQWMEERRHRRVVRHVRTVPAQAIPLAALEFSCPNCGGKVKAGSIAVGEGCMLNTKEVTT